MKTALVVIQIISAIVIIISVLLQPSKMDGLNNMITGTTDTFFSRNKSKTKEAFLARITIFSSLVFAIVVIIENTSKFTS